ncbi:recombinase family protein [Desulfatitalea tepidiphila]|uniref:recombinase family protein n=1 Tax=Desulfatitalea tepidiphila TaxID=1185843 RepID=UPI0006B65AA2|nr:recombinase family protein [Desulfatitalea tepidiphila]
MKAKHPGKTIAYVRVSTDKQDMENQRLEILKMANDRGLGKVRFVEETVTGRKNWRSRKLAGALEELSRDDALLVCELSRLGRSMLEIMEILSIASQAGVRVFAAKGSWALDGTIQSKLVAMCFSMAAEIERDLISQRTKAALATKRAQGVKLGRPKGPGRSKLDSKRDEIIELLELGITRKRLAEKLGTTPLNLRHWLKKRGMEALGKAKA